MSTNIDSIKRKLLIKYPTFGSVIANLEFQASRDIETVGTDGKVLLYNPDFLDSLSEKQKIFIFAHEVCHVAFEHIYRSEGKDRRLWNIATDSVINALLKHDGLPLVEGGVDIPEAINYDAEEMYNKLLEEEKKKQQQNNQGNQGQQGEQNSQEQENNQDSQKQQSSQGSQGQQNSQDSPKQQSSQGNQGQQNSQDSSKQQSSQGSQGQENNQDSQKQQSSQGSQGQQNSQDSQKQQSSQGSQGQENNQDSQKQQSSQGSQGQENNQDSQKQQSSQGSQGQQNSQDSQKQQSSQGSQGQENNQDSQKQQSSQGGQGQQNSQDSQEQQSSQGSQGQQNSQESQEQQSSQVNQGEQNYQSQQQENDIGHDTHSLWDKAIEERKKEQQSQSENRGQKQSQTKKKEKSERTDEEEKGKKEAEEKSEFAEKGEKETFKQNRIERRKQLQELSRELANKSSQEAGDGIQREGKQLSDIGIATPLIDWRKLLRQAIRYDEEYTRKNARMRNGYFRHRVEQIPMPEAEILLDTSGSVSEVLLKNFLRECKNILDNSKVKVGCFNTEFHGFTELKKPEDIDNMRFPIGGGTDFNAAVEAFSRKAPNKIIFTDGEADMPRQTVRNVIWVVFGNEKINPKGGKVINITGEQLDRLYQSFIRYKDDITR